MNHQIFLQRISDKIYGEAVNFLSNEYNFLNGADNGGRMRLANYFVGISESLSDEFIAFIDNVVSQTKNNNFPKINLPEGFSSQDENLTDFEKTNKFSFGSFDMAVTENGLQSIEFQAIATYPFTAAKLNQFIKSKLNLSNTYIFANNKRETWDDFISIYKMILGGKYKNPMVLIDSNLHNTKTNCEFSAMQKELGISLDIVDFDYIFEQNEMLFYQTATNENKKLERLYNRVLPSEAIYEDHYPSSLKWGFRYDQLYQDLKLINHPRKLFEVSKRLLPYLNHPFNPPAFE